MEFPGGSRETVDQTQVRLQLRSRQADISLPDNTGPILVNTSMHAYKIILSLVYY